MSEETTYDVKTVSFNPDGSVVFEYNELPGDARERGFGKTHGLLVPSIEETADALEHLHELCQRALSDFMAHFEAQKPLDFERILIEEDLIDGEEEPSPWDNPVERDVDAAEG